MTNMRTEVETLEKSRTKWKKLKDELIDQLRDPNLPLEKRMILLITIRQIDDDLRTAEKLIERMRENPDQTKAMVSFWRIMEPIEIFLEGIQ